MTTPRPELEAEAKMGMTEEQRTELWSIMNRYSSPPYGAVRAMVDQWLATAHARGRAEGLDQAQDAAESFITFKQPGDSVDTRTIHTNATASAIAAAIRALGGPRGER